MRAQSSDRFLSPARYKDVDENQIKSLPHEIANLPALEDLRIRGNPLLDLPAEVWALPKLKELHLDGEQWSRVPEAIRKRGKPELLVL